MSISNNFNRFISWLEISDAKKISKKKVLSQNLEDTPETPPPDLRKKAISKEAMFEIMDHVEKLSPEAFMRLHKELKFIQKERKKFEENYQQLQRRLQTLDKQIC